MKRNGESLKIIAVSIACEAHSHIVEQVYNFVGEMLGDTNSES